MDDPGPLDDPGRRIPVVVWAVTALHVALMLCFSLLYPPFTGFDEVAHVDAVLAIRHGHGWPAPTERELSEGVVATSNPVLLAATRLPFSDDPLAARADRPSIASLGVNRDSTTQPLPNQITQHPPLYYAAGAAVLLAIPGSADWPFDRTVAALRLLSILFMAPLPLLAWATARALRASAPVATAAAALPLSVPQLARVGGSVNNDALYALAFATALLLLVRVAMGDLQRRTVLLTGAAVGLALLTKGFALVLPLAVVACFVVAGRRGRDAGWWRAGALCLAVAFVVGGWWWLRNLVLYGAVQPAGWSQEAYRAKILGPPRAPGTSAPLDDFISGLYARLSVRFWGGLGINYTGPATYPRWVTDLLVGCVVAAVLVALVRFPRSRAAVGAALLLPLAATLGLIAVGAYSSYQYSLAFPGTQGRYLFGSLPGLSAVVALGLAAAFGRRRQLLPALVVLFALVMQAVGISAVLDRQWLPRGEGRSWTERYDVAVDGIVRWAPWPAPFTQLLMLSALTGAVVVLVLVVRVALAARTSTAPVAG